MEKINSPELLLSKISGKEEDNVTNIFLWVMIVVVLLFIILRGVVFATVYVSGDSMLPTLHDGDYLLGDRFSALTGAYDVGDIVTIDTGVKVGNDTKKIIKRIVGLEGDVIELIDGKLYRNGEIVDEPYLDDDEMTYPIYGGAQFPYTVKKGEVFVLGDNRGSSRDSRFTEYLNISVKQIFAVIPDWAIENMDKIEKYIAATK